MSLDAHQQAALETELAQLLAPAAPGEWTPPAGLAAAMRRATTDAKHGAVALAVGDDAMRAATRSAVALAAVAATVAAIVAGNAPAANPAEAPSWLKSDLVQLSAVVTPKEEQP